MDVSKLFSKSPEQGEAVPSEQVSPIGKQKSPPEIVKDYLDESVDDFENEGGTVYMDPSIVETVEAQLRAPIYSGVAVTVPLSPEVHPLYKRYNKFWLKVREIRDKKGKDYGTKEDPFANIRGAQEFGVAPWIGAANSANDCLTRIKQFARTGRLENESVEDSMLDLANYALICLTLWDEAREANETGT